MRNQSFVGLVAAAITIIVLGGCGNSPAPDSLAQADSKRVHSVPLEGQSIFRSVVIDEQQRALAGGTRRTPDDMQTFMLLARFLADGRLDPEFGQNGLVELLAPGRFHGTIHNLIIDVQSRIVACGFWYLLDNEGNIAESTAVVARFFADGSPDTGFGRDGVAELPAPLFGTYAYCSGVREVSGNYVIAGGNFLPNGISPVPDPLREPTGNLARPVSSYAFLARVDDAGTLDPAFGIGGAVQVYSGTTSYPRLDRDGTDRLYVVYNTYGFIDQADTRLQRYLPDGSPDTEYGEDGRRSLATTDGSAFTSAYALSVRDDGTAWVSGLRFPLEQERWDAQAWRVSATGQRDFTVEKNSRKSLSPDTYQELNLIALKSDRKPVTVRFDAEASVWLVHLTENGTPDSQRGGFPGQRLAVYPLAMTARPFTVTAGVVFRDDRSLASIEFP
jgi:uncharacterized delta-60 repeat protein